MTNPDPRTFTEVADGLAEAAAARDVEAEFPLVLHLRSLIADLEHEATGRETATGAAKGWREHAASDARLLDAIVSRWEEGYGFAEAPPATIPGAFAELRQAISHLGDELGAEALYRTAVACEWLPAAPEATGSTGTRTGSTTSP